MNLELADVEYSSAALCDARKNGEGEGMGPQTDDEDDALRTNNVCSEHSQLIGHPHPELMSNTIMKQKPFSHQAPILNSNNYSICDLDTKRQPIFHRRHLHSHHRQYEQWRRKQFSYDPSYYRPSAFVSDQSTSAAFHRRRQYRRQFSCVDPGQHSRDSQETALVCSNANAAFRDTNSTFDNPKERLSLESSECVALTYQSLHCNNNKNARMLQNEHRSVSERRSRSRINSAIFVSSEEKGFDSIEFLRRHGSQSVLCRKAKSAENLRQNEAKMITPNKLQCYTDECSKTNNGDNNSDCNELKIRRVSSSMQNKDLPVPMLYSKDEANFSNFVTNRACANTTSNVVIGDISIEALPTSIESEPFPTDNSKSVQMLDRRYITKEMPDTGKEFVAISTKTEPYDCTHPCSENLSMSNQSLHPHKRPQALNLRNGRKQAALPMVSVSGPPTADAEELQRAESL